MLEGKPHSGGAIEPQLREQVLSLSKSYQQRYGAPGSKLRVEFQGAAQRAETQYRIRDDDEFAVMTGIMQRRARWGTGTNLVAVAVVCNRKLRGEARLDEFNSQAEDSGRRRRSRKEM
jgi:hypothetical protein